jgi:hypothetical protein
MAMVDCSVRMGWTQVIGLTLAMLVSIPPQIAAAQRIGRRHLLAARSDPQIEVQRALKRPIDFDFDQVPLGDVVAFIGDYTGVKVVFDHASAATCNVDTPIPVSLSLDSMPLELALPILLDPLGLSYEAKDGILRIVGSVEVRVYPVNALSPYVFAEEGESAAFAIQRMIAPGSWDEKGIGTITFDPLRQSFVVRHSPRHQQAIARLLHESQGRAVSSCENKP